MHINKIYSKQHEGFFLNGSEMHNDSMKPLSEKTLKPVLVFQRGAFTLENCIDL